MDDTTIKNSNSDRGIKPIHTYTSDMADAVRENEASVIKIALAEKNKREQEEVYKEAKGTGTSKFFLVLGSIILISGALVGSYFLFTKDATITPETTTTKDIETVISYNDKVFLDITNTKNQNELAALVNLEVGKVGKPRSIKSLFLTEKTTTVAQLLPLRDLLLLMNISAPSAFVRTLGESYMIGTYTDEATTPAPHLFVIFTIKDYNQAYASSLEWEKTLLTDFFLMFNTDVSGGRKELFEKTWKDIIVDNKDARILYDNAGTDILYYMFINKDTFVVTDSKGALREINTRLLGKSTKSL